SMRMPSVCSFQRGGSTVASNPCIRENGGCTRAGCRLRQTLAARRVRQHLLIQLVRGGITPMKKYGLFAVCLLAAAMLLAACGSSSSSSSSTSGGSSSGSASSSGGKGGKIAFLLPESKTARYETQDRPLFA